MRTTALGEERRSDQCLSAHHPTRAVGALQPVTGSRPFINALISGARMTMCSNTWPPPCVSWSRVTVGLVFRNAMCCCLRGYQRQGVWRLCRLLGWRQTHGMSSICSALRCRTEVPETGCYRSAHGAGRCQGRPSSRRAEELDEFTSSSLLSGCV